MAISHDMTVAAIKGVLDPGDDVLVHASLGRIGWFEAGVDSVIAALRDAVGPMGTVIMMTDTRSFARTGLFSLQQPSESGLLTERFRLTEGATRSCVPMVSFVATGPKSDYYTQGYDSHLDDTATLARLLSDDGKIMLMGIGYEKCTLYHLAEERHAVHYNFYKEFQGVFVSDGKPVRPISQRYFVRRELNVRKDPAIAGRMLEERGNVKVASLGNASLRAFRARDFDTCCMTALAEHKDAFIVGSWD